MEVGIVIACGISLGLIYIYKSMRQAGEDMESFDSISISQKFKKPEGWKVGKLPSEISLPKRNTRIKSTADIS